jgi:hypothetical protein
MKPEYEQALKEVADLHNEMYRMRRQADNKLRQLVNDLVKEDNPHTIMEMLRKIPPGPYRMELSIHHADRLQDKNYRHRSEQAAINLPNARTQWNNAVKGLLHGTPNGIMTTYTGGTGTPRR